DEGFLGVLPATQGATRALPDAEQKRVVFPVQRGRLLQGATIDALVAAELPGAGLVFPGARQRDTLALQARARTAPYGAFLPFVVVRGGTPGASAFLVAGFLALLVVGEGGGDLPDTPIVGAVELRWRELP